MANPSSLHTSGKATHQLLQQLSEELLNFFGLQESHDLLFHSGATEGINLLAFGLARQWQEQHLSGWLVACGADHPAVRRAWSLSAEQVEGMNCFELPIEESGLWNPEVWHSWFAQRAPQEKILLNATALNSVTGVVWLLGPLAALKARFPQLHIHVDATQFPFKWDAFRSLDASLDYYTFSGHKLGALTGIGWTFIKKGAPRPRPLLYGGGATNSLRAGTPNIYGIYSLLLALREGAALFCPQRAQRIQHYFESELLRMLDGKGTIAGLQSSSRSLTTFALLLSGIKADLLFAALDWAQIIVGRGPACSSGTGAPDPTLMAMGHSPKAAAELIRISYSPFLTDEQAEQTLAALAQVLRRF